MDVTVLKKNGLEVPFNIRKVFTAVNKSAKRATQELTDDDLIKIQDYVQTSIFKMNLSVVDVPTMHNIVEQALSELGYEKIAKEYRSYRNWKREFSMMMSDVIDEYNNVYYSNGTHENANADESLVTTKRCKVSNKLNGEFYKKFFLNKDELQAIIDGYYYIHDRNARLDTYNCSLFDLERVLTDGFVCGSQSYTEPKTISAAINVSSDIMMMAASQQYGGFTVLLDTTLAKYVEKSYDKYYDEELSLAKQLKVDTSDPVVVTLMSDEALRKVKEDIRQGIQGLEQTFNSVASSRGDFVFITIAFGLGTKWSEKLISSTLLEVRMTGQGKEGRRKPVVFPKLVFLYDKELHSKGKVNNDLYELALKCSSKAMYPDYLSLTGDGYVCSIYKKYHTPILPMGCRAYLSAWYERGGRKPADDQDKPVFMGRFNLGAISLNLPMIYQKSVVESTDKSKDDILKRFYKNLETYLEQIRSIHLRTIEFLGKKKASMSPLAFCEGGLLGGNLKPDDCIAPVLKSCTISFGITALNELQILHNGKPIAEDNTFAKEVVQFISDYKDRITEEDDVLYALYGTPAESLSGLQVKQFRNKFGIIKGVSDKDYFTNSFHCDVSANITPIEKQDKEYELFHMINGGHIQYVRYNCNYNIDAIRSLVDRAMNMGFYEGVNFNQSYCDNCGRDFIDSDECPYCGSHNITTIDRVCGYLGYSRLDGSTRMNAAKLAELKDRVSM